MRLALLDWILIAVSLIKISKQEESTSESIVLVTSGRQDQRKDSEEKGTSDLINIQFPVSEVGKDTLEIPKSNQITKAGQEKMRMELQPGLVMEKEIATKPSNQKHIQAGFKLLDWKRRRKRLLEQWNHVKKSEIPGGDEKSRKAFNICNEKESNFNNNVNLVERERNLTPAVTPVVTENKDKMAEDFEKSDTTDSQRDSGTAVHILTQPHEIDSGIKDSRMLDDIPELQNVSTLINRNFIRTKRRTKNQKPHKESHEDFENEIYDDIQTDDDKEKERKRKEVDRKQIKNHSNVIHAALDIKEAPREKSAALSKITTKPMNLLSSSKTLTTQKYIFHYNKNESFLPKKKTLILCKAKEIASGGTLPSKEEVLDSILDSKGNLIDFAKCVTPPSTTSTCASSDATTEEPQVAECHPKGTGPLSPNNYDPDEPKQEEVEDALSGKLADRVVEVVMAKVGKEPRMMKELGLSCQENLTKIQASITHPDSKQGCSEISEDLKQSVLQEIAAAVEKLAQSNHGGACLKPPEDLTAFLAWLLSDDSQADMPLPNPPDNRVRRQDGEFLFRTSMLSNENQDPKELSNCNWDDWMMYSEVMSDDSDLENSNFDSFENKHHSKNRQRITRNASKRKKKHHKENHLTSDERRRKYTPWSLSDYP